MHALKFVFTASWPQVAPWQSSAQIAPLPASARFHHLFIIQIGIDLYIL